MTNTKKNVIKKTPLKKNTQFSLLEIISREFEAGENEKNISSILKLKQSDTLWRGFLALPGGTLLGDIVLAFDKETNIPLELPFFTFFHYVSAALLHKGVSIKLSSKDTRNVIPDIWTVLLASSGSGKSWTNSTIQHGIPELKEVAHDIAGTVSTAKFVEDLQEHNRKLYIRDEFAELYKQIAVANSGPLAQLKDYLLRIYNNSDIDWTTKKGKIEIVNTAISFLGMTVEQSFAQMLTTDDLVNGFAQRFSFIRAQKDPHKDFLNYPIYDIDMSKWQGQWTELINSIQHSEYYPTKKAETAFKNMFRSLARTDLDESFYRRQLWKGHKYALIYHIILGKGDCQKLDAQDYDWAAKIIYMMLEDFQNILQDYDTSQTAHTLKLVEKLYERFRAEGKEVTPRDIVQRIRAIRSVNEAKALMSIANKN